MQAKKQNATRVNLRPPLIAAAVIGSLMLLLFFAVSLFVEPVEVPLYGVAIIGVYALAMVVLLVPYLSRHRRVERADSEADLLVTEINDMFRFVVDIPYAIVSEEGMVKVVSAELQSILKYRSPICNVPLSDFCSLTVEDLISYTKIGTAVPVIEKNISLALEDKTPPMRIVIDGAPYSVRSFVMPARGKNYYLVIFDNISEKMALETKMRNEDPVVAYIEIDNLQELTQYIRVDYRQAVIEIETALRNWAAKFGGLLREYDREKYLLILTREALDGCIKRKFKILETVREIKLGDNSFPVTLSIGVGVVPGSFEQRSIAARNALNVALQKGGDQVVINDGASIKAYGARVNTVFGQTAILSRTNSAYLCRLMREAGNVLIMGHTNPDYDSIGSCVGLARLAICARGGDSSKIRIVVNRDHANFRACYDFLASLPEYRSMFISGDTAMDAVRSDTLLVLGDVNNPYNVESQKLYRAVKNIAVVDHHRRGDGPLDDRWKLEYIYSQASSASELVSEMFYQSPYRENLLKEEANLLLAGIVLDTKNFTQVSNMEVFSKIDYLTSRSAHTSRIRELFSQTMENLFAACDIDSRTRTYRDIIALTWLSVDHEATEDDRIAVAKAADKLMTIVGIEASFALLRAGNTVHISARSKDRVNVQVIAEKLKGGGHFDMAGAKLVGVTLETACNKLKNALDDYLDNEYDGHKHDTTTKNKHGEKK